MRDMPDAVPAPDGPLPAGRAANAADPFGPSAAGAAPSAAQGLAIGPWLARRLRRALLLMTALCTAIGLLLTAMYRHDGVVGHFVYAFSIGFSCWAFTDGARLALSVLGHLWRSHRGQPPVEHPLINGWRVMVPLMVGGTVVGLPVGVQLGGLLWGGYTPDLLRWDAPGTRVTLAITVIASLFCLFAISTLERLAAARVSAEAARTQAMRLELKLLQSQLEPHMLFNTLANLRVLIGLDAERAQAMLDHLIGFLRATLNASRLEQHALATEFARVEDYLALMRYRMGPRLQASLHLPHELAQVAVPPLLLQPLVENAIRHGLEPQVGAGRLEVRAEAADGVLRLSVRDSGVGLADAAAAPRGGTSFGLQQIRERLRTLYDQRARLQLLPAADGDGGTVALIEMPLLPLPPRTAPLSAPAVASERPLP